MKQGLIDAAATNIESILNETSERDRSERRNLAQLRSRDPLSIVDIFDIESGCDPGLNCILVTSTASVLMRPGNNPASINGAIVRGVRESIEDGSFYAALPKDVAACLTT